MFSRRRLIAGAAGIGSAAHLATASAATAAQEPSASAQAATSSLLAPPAHGLQLPARVRADRVLDNFSAAANRRYTLAELEGPGCIRHIWVTSPRSPLANRRIIVRMYWDGEANPSVETPLGDFFGVCHGLTFYPINTQYLSVQEQSGYNCYFPMPFQKSARIEIETGPEAPGGFYYHVDWHRYPKHSAMEGLRFHASWRREFPAQHYGEEFTVLDAVGAGRLLGFAYGVRLYDGADRWSHGGSENIYIDGEVAGRDDIEPIYIRGSGGEDTFGTSYGGALHNPETHLYAGIPYYVYEDFGGGPRASQRVGAYRFFDEDAITFERSIHFRFGCMANDICGTAYWYQAEPHRPFVRMPAWDRLMPGTDLLRGQTDLLLQTGAAGTGAILASPEDGEWWLCGPFENERGEGMNRLLPPEQGLQPDPSARYDGGFGEASPWRYAKSERADQHMAHWVRRWSVHCFVDFTHVFRPWMKGVSVTWPAVACAQTTLISDRDTSAKLYLSWDDHAIIRVNEAAPFDLGAQAAFRQRTVDVRLKRGANRVVIKLNNTKGQTWGGWCFAFRALLPDGSVIRPTLHS